MEQINQSLSLQCPDHGLAIGLLSTDLKAKKIGYCYECIAEKGGDATFLQTLKTVSSYLKDSSSFYEKCRQKGSNASQTPAGFLEELSKKGERLEKFSRYIDEEKDKVKKNFEEIRKNIIQIIDQKENKCLELLDKEVSGLSAAYAGFEMLLMMGWPEASEIGKVYPDADSFKQGIIDIQDMNQLRAFMTKIQQDIQLKSYWGLHEGCVIKLKNAVDDLISCLNTLEPSPPKIQGDILNGENIENFVKDLMKGFTQQEVRMENSIVAKMNTPSYGSKIISDEKFQILKDWMPKGYKFHLKLLYRSSVDGKSAQIFHQKCDDKGATITLVKCRFQRALSDSIIGGFLDQSWHSNNRFGSSKEAFLFLLGAQRSSSIKCPISEPQYAFYGDARFGPTFGQRHDLHIGEGFLTGMSRQGSYSNSVALSSNLDGVKFFIEELEVFQVQ